MAYKTLPLNKKANFLDVSKGFDKLGEQPYFKFARQRLGHTERRNRNVHAVHEPAPLLAKLFAVGFRIPHN